MSYQHCGNCEVVRKAPNSTLVASGDSTGTLIIWDMNDPAKNHVLEESVNNGSTFRDISFNKENDKVAFVNTSKGTYGKIYDLSQKKEVGTFKGSNSQS